MNRLQTLNETTIQLSWLDQFRSYLETDLRKVTRRQLSKGSIKNAIGHVRVFSLWHEAEFKGSFAPDQLTAYDLHAYRKWSLDDEKVIAATWNARHWALTIFCSWIQVTFGYTDLMDGVDKKKSGITSTKHRSLTEDERNRLIHTLEQDPRRAVTIFEHQVCIRNWATVSIMLHAGLRVEEVSLVDVDDITINGRSGSVRVRNGKGSKERTVPLNLTARRAIAAWLDLRPASTSQALFTGKQSPRLTTRSLERIVEEIGHRISVPDLTPHWLRYTFAKTLEKNNVAIEAIRDLLGHANIETTRKYLRSSFEELQSAVEVG